MSLFKVNYSYKLKILFMPQQTKKISEIVKKRIDKYYGPYKQDSTSTKKRLILV